MLLVVLATGGSALLVLGQLRDLRASFDLMVVYVEMQVRIGEAEAQSARIGAWVEQNDRLAGGGPFEAGSMRAERDLLLFADGLEDRVRRVEEIRHPVDEALAHPERIGDEHEAELQLLREQIVALERAVTFDDSDDPLDLMSDVRRQSLVNERFRRLAETSTRIVRDHRESVAAAGKRAERLTFAVTLAGSLLGIVAVFAVYVTLRPLRRLSQGVRRLGKGDWSQRIDLGDGPPSLDDEVSRLAREFNLMAEALEERERLLIRGERLAAVGQLAAQITHEVRNPLSSVALNVELLEDELDDATPEARALLSTITGEVDRLTALTEDYLAFARRPKPELAVIDLAAELADLVSAERLAFDQAGVPLEADFDLEGLPVMGDASQLRRVFLNLLRNAREAVEERLDGEPSSAVKPHVRVTARCKDAQVTVVVSDTGGGIDMPPGERERIFEAFFTRKAKGTGLGLSTVQQIVQDHGGRVQLADTGPQGTTFEVVLPACAAESPSVSSSFSEDGEIA